jgi:hypothetical protein
MRSQKVPAQNMDATGSFETSVYIYQNTRRPISEDSNIGLLFTAGTIPYPFRKQWR